MLFTINDLGFSIAGLLLEGWLAFAARLSLIHISEPTRH